MAFAEGLACVSCVCVTRGGRKETPEPVEVESFSFRQWDNRAARVCAVGEDWQGPFKSQLQ